MRAYYPVDLYPAWSKVAVLFPSCWSDDIGKTIESVIESRGPAAIINFQTGVGTDLKTFRQAGVPMYVSAKGGLTKQLVGIDLNNFHMLHFKDATAAIAFLQEKYPKMRLMPFEYYERQLQYTGKTL